MRIIAGDARGMVLATPPEIVRPTMDRVRAAIFSSLGDAVPGARVLDLFSGSGAMGVEALSRGARSCTFVELNPACVACVRANLKKAGLEGNVQTMDALKYLDLYAMPESFDLIFADPPYSKAAGSRDFSQELLKHPGLATVLAPHGTFILEYFSRMEEPENAAWRLLRARRYGKSEIAYYVRS